MRAQNVQRLRKIQIILYIYTAYNDTYIDYSANFSRYRPKGEKSSFDVFPISSESGVVMQA